MCSIYFVSLISYANEQRYIPDTPTQPIHQHICIIVQQMLRHKPRN